MSGLNTHGSIQSATAFFPAHKDPIAGLKKSIKNIEEQIAKIIAANPDINILQNLLEILMLRVAKF